MLRKEGSLHHSTVSFIVSFADANGSHCKSRRWFIAYRITKWILAARLPGNNHLFILKSWYCIPYHKRQICRCYVSYLMQLSIVICVISIKFRLCLMEDILHIRIEFPWSYFDANKVASTLPHMTLAYTFDPYEEMDIVVKGVADVNLLSKLRNPHPGTLL